jgi:myo-inositol-1(or 4)-monophosphatase
MDLDSRWTFIQALADEAGAMALSYFERRAELTVDLKGPQDLVSAADRDVEALIRRRVAERFPTDAVLGEEEGGVSAEAIWVVDPIDGTTNFLRGLPHYCVSIAFVHQQRIELGVITAPTLKETFAARAGHGATLNGSPIRASSCVRLDQSLLGWGSSRRTPQQPYLDALGQLLTAGAEYRRLGSAALNLCQVACGRLDSFVEAKLASWDALAGMLLVREAGGVTNDFLANDGLTRGNAVLAACTPPLYEALIRATGLASSAG